MEVDVDESSVNVFVAEFDNLLSGGNIEKALELLFSTCSRKLVVFGCLDVIIIIGRHMRAPSHNANLSTLYDMLGFVVDVCSAKEALLGLTGLFEAPQNDEEFSSLLKLLKQVFLTLPASRGDAFFGVICCGYSYLRQLQFQLDARLSIREQIALVNNDSFFNCRVEHCYESMLKFFDPFVNELAACSKVNPALTSGYKRLLPLTIIKYLGLIATTGAGIFPDSITFSVAQSWLRLMAGLCPTFPISLLALCHPQTLLTCSYHQYEEVPCPFRDVHVSLADVGIVAYLVRCCRMELHALPAVYTWSHLFNALLPCVLALLRCLQQSLLVTYGVLLLDDLCGLPDSELEDDRLGDPTYSDSMVALVDVMRSHEQKEQRQKALEVFTRFLRLFTPHGRMKIIQLIFARTENLTNADDAAEQRVADNGIRGYVVDFYRSCLREEGNLHAKQGTEDFRVYSRELERLVSLFTFMPDKEETDLLQFTDQYMACLNLLRYILLAQNLFSAVWSKQFLPRVKCTFVDPLRRALELSKAHYELELKNTKGENVTKKLKKRNKLKFANIMGKEKEQVLSSAITTFELMESLLNRVCELLCT